jgi:hypothetical protein
MVVLWMLKSEGVVIHMNQYDEVTYLAGVRNVSSHAFLPFDNILCEFLDDLSTELRSNDKSSVYPDIFAFAFWCRKANINKHKTYFNRGEHRLGLGVVFHITPSNVPVNFAFSFVFGLLSGNANIVRVPSKTFPQIEIICEIIEILFTLEKYKEIKSMTSFVKYKQNDEITGMYSINSNARIIWGGDEAIKNIRKLAIQERCIDIAFSDRYSFCVIEAPSIIKLNKAELIRLSESFYNDTYLMDQNACSSPHLIIWLGEEIEEAKELFWNAVYETVSKKYELKAVNAVSKYTMLCQNAIDLNNIRSFKRHGNHIYRVELEKLPNNIDSFRGKFGYFYEINIDNLNSIEYVVNSKYQTLTYFGADKSIFLDFVLKNRLAGIDRIVPIGKALDMDLIWDGYDIIRSLSRIIDIK